MIFVCCPLQQLCKTPLTSRQNPSGCNIMAPVPQKSWWCAEWRVQAHSPGMPSLFQRYLRYKVSVGLLTEGKLSSVQRVEQQWIRKVSGGPGKLDLSHLNNFLGWCQSAQSAEATQLCTEPKQRPRLGCLWNHKTKLKTKPVMYAEWHLLDATVPSPL